MTKPRERKMGHSSSRIICASVSCWLVYLAVLAILFATGYKIYTVYSSIFWGNLPSEIDKMTLDYSITIFTGGAILLLVYSVNVKNITRKLFGAEDVKPIVNSRNV